MFVPFECFLTPERVPPAGLTGLVSTGIVVLSGAAAGSAMSLCWQDFTGPDNYRTNAGTPGPIVIIKWILSDCWVCSDVQCVSKCLKCI